MRATYLGWQGWLVESAEATILVDPLLFDEIGRGPAGARQRSIFHPPRRLRYEQLPPVDAVFLSHEHEDHFDLPTLLAIDPAIPIYLSALSSTAARTILRELDRACRLWHPAEICAVGDLEIIAFAPDHVAQDQADEWDTLGYLIRQRDGGGALFSNVDIAFTETMHEALAAEPRPPLVFDDLDVLLWRNEPLGDPGEAPRGRVRADGEEARAWLAAGERLRPLPGQSFVLGDGVLREVEARRAFLECPPQAEWPEAAPYWPPPDALRPVLAPTLGPDEERELERELADLARYLYGGVLFRRFYSLPNPLALAREPALALVARRQGREPLTFVFRPASGCFERVALDEAAAQASFLAGVVCWAGDLLALFRREMEARAIAPGYWEWADPVLGPLRLHVQVLAPYFHPLRGPERCLARYRRLVAEERGAPCRVRARRESIVGGAG